MKKYFLPGLAAAGGLAGFALRAWQLSAAADPASGIFRSGHPATLALVLLSAAMALLFLLLVWHASCPEEGVFFCPSSFYMALMAAGGLLLLAAGGLELTQTLAAYQDLRAAALPEEPVPFPVLEVLCGVLCLPAGAGLLVFGRASYRGQDSTGRLLSSLAPGYLALALLIRYYVAHSSDPLLLRYSWSLLGWVSTLAALYAVASCCYRKPAPRAVLFFGGMAVFLQLTALADRPDRFQALCGMALILSLLAQSTALAQACFGPRMPSGAQEKEHLEPKNEE